MTPERWARTKSILESALERPAAARSAFLDGACGGDAGLRAEVEELLGFEDEARHMLDIGEGAAPEDAGTGARASDGGTQLRFGPYRVVREIGEGGMGLVYLAERDDGEFVQTVAVKVVRPGPGHAGLAARFRAERDILARLEHPGIARILDGGSAPDGQLYYAMEYVKGVPVTAYCRDRELTLRARLELFSRICLAVAHAHRNLIIHRDLKPANILVTADGSPKLLDFGLAKVFEGAADAGLTTAMAPLLTPAYASPEQVRGGALTTATDVYSLGVILYELLTGRSPYGERTTSPLETMRAVCEQEPPSPRAVAGRKVPADAGDIALKALRKEPDRRYASVDELREDVERHLSGLPVRASRGTLAYVAGKFVRRHKWGVAAAALVSLGAAAAFQAIVWQRQQAELRFEQGRRFAHSVVFELHDAIRDLPGATSARKLLTGRTLVYLNELAATSGKDRGLMLELASAYYKVGSVQGYHSGANLGDTKGAIDSFNRERRILLELLRSDPNDGDALLALAQADVALTDVYEGQGNMAPWRELKPELEQALQGVIAHRRGTADAAWAYGVQGLLLESDGKWKEAIPVLERTSATYSETYARSPGDLALARELARSYGRLAQARQQTGDLEGAAREYRASERVYRNLVAAQPRNADARMGLSFALVELGWVLHELRQHRAAIAVYGEALGIQEELAAADPNDSRARLEAAKLMITAAPAWEGAGERAKAGELYTTALSRLRAELGRAPGSRDIRVHMAWALQNLGDLCARRSEWPRALSHYRRAREIVLSLMPDGAVIGIFDIRPMLAHLDRQLDPAKRVFPPLHR